MPSEYYFAEDGSIHRHPMTSVNNTRIRTNTYAANSSGNEQIINAYGTEHHVNTGRIVWFWIISIVVSVLIATGVYQIYGAEAYGNESGIFSEICPIVCYTGAIAGNILYGVFCAKSLDYNLWTYFLSAVSSVGGIIITGIVAAVTFFFVMLLFYVFVIAVGIVVICCLAGGS